MQRIKREIILLELNDKGEVVNDSIDYVKMCDFFEFLGTGFPWLSRYISLLL